MNTLGPVVSTFSGWGVAVATVGQQTKLPVQLARNPIFQFSIRHAWHSVSTKSNASHFRLGGNSRTFGNKMLAAHREDQENRFSHQAGPSKQQLQAKTPGARYPKTPLKVPLNDENANNGFGGKSVLRTKGNNENVTTIGKSGKLSVVTPAGPRAARAPLGNKTTNAKARAGQQTGGRGAKGIREIEKTTAKPTTSVRPKQAAPQVELSKIEVHTDRSPLEEEDIEYAPPKPKELPYESDVLPAGTLTFEGLKPENMFKGYYEYYFNHVDDDGVTETERRMEEQRQREFQRGDEQIRKDMDEFDWSVDDVPASKEAFNKKKDKAMIGVHSDIKPTHRQFSNTPATIAARKAASVLAMPLKPTAAAQSRIPSKPLVTKRSPLSLLAGRKPAKPVAPARNSSQERATAVAASRSTLGYSKGRSALSAVRGRNEPTATATTTTAPPTTAPAQSDAPVLPRTGNRTLMRSASTASSSSDSTITPARFAQTQSNKDWKKLEFLSIFDVDEDDEGNLGGTPQLDDDLDDDFQLPTDF